MPQLPTTSREAVIERIDTDYAFLRVETEELRWPLASLPPNCRVGDRIHLLAMTPEQAAAERNALAKQILNEALNPSA